MGTRTYEAQRASWTEDGSAEVAIQTISARVKRGRVVDQGDTALTVQYGSPAMFRLMGGLFTARWFPMTASVTAVGNDNRTAVEVVGADRKGPFLGDISIRRGERSIGEHAFIAQFQYACAELSGSGEDERPSRP